ncbi:MAG: TerB family tellurite resistance protein [Polyangiaceae bacterium]|nr:TerB family tellurite resistance protein [Myxococcales bacterium]MCB9590322.1 TerB family tellurite resistance protein [Polyangiaceae bacterium]MCB9605023.1 TerB family tellurite resistance protein [Polyangiaceae bacterium]
MTPEEKNIVRSLIAVAWADGEVAAPEEGVIDGFLGLYDASDEEEAELKEFAKERKTLDDVPFDELDDEGKEILLSNAALLSAADGKTSESEQKLLDELVKRLKLNEAEAKRIIASARDGAIAVGNRLLEDAD